jgi:hypothetical protein
VEVREGEVMGKLRRRDKYDVFARTCGCKIWLNSHQTLAAAQIHATRTEREYAERGEGHIKVTVEKKRPSR